MTGNPLLLIDARNALYRAAYAVASGTGVVQGQPAHSCLLYFLRHATSWVRLFRPESVHVFWDAPRESLWRRTVLAGYKDREHNGYTANVAKFLDECIELAMALLPHLGVRQYLRNGMEADDLIYAAATVIHPRPMVIISTDSDLTQIPFMMSSAKIFDPKNKTEVPIPSVHPAVQKALRGDRTDLVDGYAGIGKVKSSQLLEDPAALQSFLDSAGREMFHRNLLLIDLSLCPRLLANQLFVRKVLATEAICSRAEAKNVVTKHRFSKIVAEFDELIAPFERVSAQWQPLASTSSISATSA